MFKSLHQKSTNIHVICRIKPYHIHIDNEKNTCAGFQLNEKKMIYEINGKRSISILLGEEEKEKFEFNYIFDELSRQRDVYEYISKEGQGGIDIIGKIWEGINCTVFVYGENKTGKSYTINNFPSKNKDDFGLLPRILKGIFMRKMKMERRKVNVSVKMSVFDVYKEKIVDLLALKRMNAKKKDDFNNEPLKNNGGLIIKEDSKSQKFFVEGLKEIICNDLKMAYKLLVIAKFGNEEKDNKLYDDRRHRITRITIIQNDEGSGEMKESVLNMVDLSGSEGKGFEGKHYYSYEKRVNENLIRKDRSLNTLGKVIYSLNLRFKYVPYRESSLTKLLKDSLGGQTFSVMILNCSSSSSSIDRTISTLRFGSVCKLIKNKLTRNISCSRLYMLKGIIQNQKSKIGELRYQLKKQRSTSTSPSIQISINNGLSQNQNNHNVRKIEKKIIITKDVGCQVKNHCLNTRRRKKGKMCLKMNDMIDFLLYFFCVIFCIIFNIVFNFFRMLILNNCKREIAKKGPQDDDFYL